MNANFARRRRRRRTGRRRKSKRSPATLSGHTAKGAFLASGLTGLAVGTGAALAGRKLAKRAAGSTPLGVKVGTGVGGAAGGIIGAGTAFLPGAAAGAGVYGVKRLASRGKRRRKRRRRR